MTPARRKLYLASVAAVVVIGGGVVARACTCVIASGGGSSAWTPVSSANIKVTTTGNDSTCTRHASLTALGSISDPCATWDKANSLAQNGDVVAVLGGSYASDGLSRLDPAEDDVMLTNDPGRSSDATFACGDSTAVTTQGRYLRIETTDLDITGGCFQLHKVLIGDLATGYFSGSKTCSGITVNNVKMQVFDISGPCNNVTISNSAVGPDVTCHGPNQYVTGNPAGCQNTPLTNEDYYFGNNEADNVGPGGNTCCTEPKIHHGGENGSTLPQNITIVGNTIKGITARDPDGNYCFGALSSGDCALHAGCLWIIGNAGITISNNTFNYCMTYDIHADDGFTSNVTITGNTFGRPTDGIRLIAINSESDWDTIPKEPVGGWVDIEVKCQDNQTLSDWTLTGNTFSANGYNLDYGGCSNPSYPGLVINSNTVPSGAPNNPSQPQP